MTVSVQEVVSRLLRQKRQEREAHAHRSQELRKLLSLEVRKAADAGLIRRAWLIGSLAWGDHGTASDIDLVVEGLAPDSHGQFWTRLVDALNIEVDLLRLEALEPSFAQRVLREGTVLP